MRLFVALLAVVQCLLVALLTVLMSSLGLLLIVQPFFLGLRKMFSTSSRVLPFVSGIKKSMKTKQQVTTPANTKKSPGLLFNTVASFMSVTWISGQGNYCLLGSAGLAEYFMQLKLTKRCFNMSRTALNEIS